MYPTMKQVEVADRAQLARWYRFLPSPGSTIPLHVSNKTYETKLLRETEILAKIKERFDAMGGFDPELSKVIGW